MKEARLEIDVNFIQKEILGMGEILSERILKKKRRGGRQGSLVFTNERRKKTTNLGKR